MSFFGSKRKDIFVDEVFESLVVLFWVFAADIVVQHREKPVF